jgi:hypothetical protein
VSRSLRLEFSVALYNVTSRGDRREDIYEWCMFFRGAIKPYRSSIILTVCRRINKYN